LPCPIYCIWALLLRKAGTITSWIGYGLFSFFLVFTGITILLGNAIYYISKFRISVTDGFITTHFLICVLLIALAYYAAFTHKPFQRQWSIDDGSPKTTIEKAALSYAQNEVLHNAPHHCYFQTMRPSKDYPGYYFAHYYYNQHEPEDTEAVKVIRMQIDINGHVAEASVLMLSGNAILEDDFYKHVRFYKALNKIQDEADKHPQSANLKPDSAMLADLKIFDDSISLK
jgi:hypothetical protein